MELSQYADICERAHMKQIEKFTYKGHDVYIADGMAMCKEMDNVLAHRTMVSIGGNKRAKGRLDIAQPLFFDPKIMKNKVLENRVAKAREHGKLLVEASIRAEKISDESKASYH